MAEFLGRGAIGAHWPAVCSLMQPGRPNRQRAASLSSKPSNYISCSMLSVTVATDTGDKLDSCALGRLIFNAQREGMNSQVPKIDGEE